MSASKKPFRERLREAYLHIRGYTGDLSFVAPEIDIQSRQVKALAKMVEELESGLDSLRMELQETRARLEHTMARVKELESTPRKHPGRLGGDE